jgi:sugar phosphate permease
MLARVASKRVHYAWIVAAATFIVLLTAAGVRAVPGVLIVPLEHEFGWNRATLSLAVSINLLLYGLCGPFAAALMERFGLRRLMIGSLLVIASAVALTTQMRSSWQLVLLWGAVVGLGTGAMAGWVAATVANRWFSQRRGLVVGVLTASAATGQLLFLPLLASLAVSAGWRWSVITVAAVALLVVPIVAVVVRDRPQDLGLRPFGEPESAPSVPAPDRATNNPMGAALATLRSVAGNRDFLLLAGSFFICGATTNGLIGTHLIPASIEHGIPEVTAAGFLAAMGVFDLVGTTCSGWLSDRFNNRWLLAWYYSLRGLSLLFLPYAFGHGYSGLAIFIVFYGLDWVATVPPTVRLTADLFGKERVPTVFAWIFTAHQLGAAAAALGAGALRTWLGDYQIAFMSAGILCLLAAGMAARIGRAQPRPTTPVRPVEAELPAVS